MFDLEHVRSEGEKYTKLVGNLLEIELTPEMATELFIASMGKVRSELYRTVLFYGQEADKCREAGAYFSCCLMTASAIEALLAVLCLTCQKEIESSPLYKDFRRGSEYEEKVLKADFHNYIDVADYLGWVPSDVVSSDLLQTAIQDFRLVAANLYPNLSQDATKEMADSFQKQPGIEMLRFLQHMRNFIHGPRWTRLGIVVKTSDFELDSQFILVIATQVMFCLISTFCKMAAGGISNASEIKDRLSQEEWTLLLQKMKEKIGIKL